MQQSESRGKLQNVSGGKACSNNKLQPTMRHLAISRYHRISGRMSAEFNVRNPSERFMLPIQEIKIATTNGRVFFVHLENWAEDHFESKLAALNLGPRLTADAIFGPFTKGKTALAAFEALILSLRLSLAKHDELDQISLVDNLCNSSEQVLDRMKGKTTPIHDNFEIMMWALGEAGINMQRVHEFLLLIDIDSARLPITDEWNYVFAA